MGKRVTTDAQRERLTASGWALVGETNEYELWDHEDTPHYVHIDTDGDIDLGDGPVERRLLARFLAIVDEKAHA